MHVLKFLAEVIHISLEIDSHLAMRIWLRSTPERNYSLDTKINLSKLFQD